MEISRESIFVSALRSFFKMFFAVCGTLIAIFLCLYAYSLLSESALIEENTTMTVLPDAAGDRNVASFSSPVILQLNIHGVIGEPHALDTEAVEHILLDSRTGLLAGDRVKGILLHFDTPGGTTVDSDNIYRMLNDYKAKYKTPIYGYIDGLCASGGVYIASSAEKVFAAPSSIIGSVGVVIGPFLNFADTLGKIGVKARTLTEGIDKDMMNPLRPWKEGEDASIKAIAAFLYERFVQIVTTSRPRLDKQKLVNEYGAQVYDCVKAEQLGYIDTAMSSRNAALTALLHAAQIDSTKPYQVVALSPKSNWVSQLVKGEGGILTGKIEHRFDFGQPKIRDRFAYLYTHE